TKNLKLPVCWTPRRKRTLTEPPLFNGAPSIIVPAERVEFNAPPRGCDGDCSRVVPRTIAVQVVPSVKKQEKGSFTKTDNSVELRARKSAKPAGDGKVFRSIIRKRSWVIGAPVLF